MKLVPRPILIPAFLAWFLVPWSVLWFQAHLRRAEVHVSGELPEGRSGSLLDHERVPRPVEERLPRIRGLHRPAGQLGSIIVFLVVSFSRTFRRLIESRGVQLVRLPCVT